MMHDTAPHMVRPALTVRFGIWNSMKSDTRSDVPSVQRSLNMRTDCGFIGDENSIGTSAGRNIFEEFCALRILVASIRRNTAEIARSTIFSFARSCSFMKTPNLDFAAFPLIASSRSISSPGPSPSSTIEIEDPEGSVFDLSFLVKRLVTSPTALPKTMTIRMNATQVFITFLSVLRSECET